MTVLVCDFSVEAHFTDVLPEICDRIIVEPQFLQAERLKLITSEQARNYKLGKNKIITEEEGHKCEN